MNLNIKHTFLITLLFFISSKSFSQTHYIQLDTTLLTVKKVADNLFLPWDMCWSKDNKIWFSERKGTIKRYNPTTQQTDSLFHINEVYQSEDNSGLHALELHPSFPLMPYLFVSYTFREDSMRLVRFTLDTTTFQVLDTFYLIKNMPGNLSHNGSRILFENDSVFFFGTGDAFNPPSAQDTNTYNGKILRLTIDGNVPIGNPFQNNMVWSLGHRNVQGLTFGVENKLYSSEHGTWHSDEINIIQPSKNYGWPNVEGYCNEPDEITYCNANQIIEPLYSSESPTFAPAGISYFNHESIPEWRNSIIITTLKGVRLIVISLNNNGIAVINSQNQLDTVVGRIRDVLVVPNGKIYICTSNKENNGVNYVQADDDKIFEISNLNYVYTKSENLTTNKINFKIYPNPSKNKLKVSLPDNTELINKVVFYNLLGEVVKTKAINNITSNIDCDISNFKTGYYIIEIHSDTMKYRKPFSKI